MVNPPPHLLVEIPVTELLDTSPIHKQLSDMEVSKGNLLRIVSPFFGKQPALEVADMATHKANPIYTRLGFREVTFDHPSTPVPVWCFVLQPIQSCGVISFTILLIILVRSLSCTQNTIWEKCKIKSFCC